LQDGGAFCAVGFARGFSEQFVVCRVVQADGVAAAAADKEVKEGVGVVVVAHPRAAEDLGVVFAAVVQVGLPFFVDEAGFHAQRVFPQGGDGNGDFFVVVVGVVEQFDAQRVFFVVTGFRVERFGFFHALLPVPGGVFGLVGRIAADAGDDEAISRFFAAGGDVFDDALAVNDEAQRFAQFGVVLERRLGEVVAEVEGAEVVVDVQFVAQVFLQPFDLVVGDVCRPVQFARAVALQFGVFVFADVVDDLVKLHILRAIVVGGFFEDDARLRFPFAHFEGAVADEVFGARPVFALFFDDVLRYGVGDGVDEQAGEVGRRFVQFDHQRFVISGADAEGIDRCIAFGDGFCVFHRVEEEAVLKFYTNKSYYKFNQALISGNKTNDVIEIEKLLNKTLDKIPSSSGTFYRGIGKEEIQMLSKYKIGDEITYKNFLSTSSERDIAIEFLTKNHLKTQEASLIIVKGKKGKLIKEYSDAPLESEILFKNGSKFKLEKVEESKLLNLFQHQWEYDPAIYGKEYTIIEID